MTKLLEKSKLCRGCTTLNMDRSNICSLSRFNKKGECPCSECLIKVICSKGCPKYSGWWTSKKELEWEGKLR